MRRASLIAILLVLLVSLFLLSVLSNVLTGYPESPPPETGKKRTGEDMERDEKQDTEEEPSVLLFKVSPSTPKLYWRVSTADYYTGLNWLRTTDERVLEEFPQSQDTNATKVFNVELNLNQQETLLPLPPPNWTLANLSMASIEGLKFYEDTVGNVYKVKKHGQADVSLVYKVSWHDIELNDTLISLDGIPEEVLNKYLQLPDIPTEVQGLAEDLEDQSYSALDQVLADVQFLRTNFVYDTGHSRYLYDYTPQGSDILSYIQRKKGICIDAATALAVFLRIQKIPARISIGYNPEKIQGDKFLYYTTGAHAVTEVYLPPYGWVQFDATPPVEEMPLVKVLPFKKESTPGNRVFYQLSVTNRRYVTDNFMLFVESKQEWNIKVVPRKIWIQALQTADAMLEVTIPEDANLGEKDVVSVTAASLSHPEVVFSVLAVIEVEDVLHISTTTTPKNIDEAVIRGDTFWVNGTVLTASNEKVDSMTTFVFLKMRREDEGIIVGKGCSKQGSFQIRSRIPGFMEIGDYQVILISLGTKQCAPSSNEYIIRVCATTEMELGSEEEFVLGYGAIHGHLLWDNGTGFAKANISLKITSLTTSSEVWESENLTSKDGSFRIGITFENPGIYEAKVMFSGNDYVLGSNATYVIKLKRGVPTVRIFGENTATRGEVFNITVTIQYEEIGVWGEPVAVTFDNQLLATIETRDSGSITWAFPVDSEETLGSHTFTASAKEGNISAVHKVTVKSKTKLTTEVSDVAGGMLVLFSASLSDDHDLPIQGADIVVDNYGLSWRTDKDGNLTFLLDTFKLWPENLMLSTGFEGSELYLPVTTEEEVRLEPFISLPFLMPLFAPTLVAIAFMCAKHYVGRQALQQISAVEVARESVVVEEEIIHRPQEMQPLKILLPHIETHFPNVWGVNDKLRIEIVLDQDVLGKIQNREAEVLVDGEAVASVRLSQQGCAELSHVFTKKGEHKVQATLQRISGYQPLNAEIKLRVVDYGEEIIRLYNEFLEKLVSYDIHARSEMTAREIESFLLRTGNFGPLALRKATTCFEKAEYSNHPAARKNYEIMYLSLKELNTDVE